MWTRSWVASLLVGVFLGGQLSADEPKFLRRADGKPIPNPDYVDPADQSNSSESGHTHFHAPYPAVTPYGYGGFPYTYGYRSRYLHYCDVCGSPYCYDPYCDRPRYYPPLFVPAEAFGFPTYRSVGRDFHAAVEASRQAAQNQQAARLSRAPANNNAPAAQLGDGQPNSIAAKVARIDPSTPAERGRADRLIAQGDELFERQAYLGALNKYRSAVKNAGDYALARFRLAHGLLARGEYAEATEEFLAALELADSTERPGFKLLDLYGGNRLAADTDLDALSQAALENPNNGELIMLVGLFLHYDQQELRGRPFFQRAAELPGPQARYAEWFLAGGK